MVGCGGIVVGCGGLSRAVEDLWMKKKLSEPFHFFRQCFNVFDELILHIIIDKLYACTRGAGLEITNNWDGLPSWATCSVMRATVIMLFFESAS